MFERGSNKLNVTGRTKTFCRWLAIMGACKLVMLVLQHALQLRGLHAGRVHEATAGRRMARNGEV